MSTETKQENPSDIAQVMHENMHSALLKNSNVLVTLQTLVHSIAKTKGWWDNTPEQASLVELAAKSNWSPEDMRMLSGQFQRNKGELLMLMVSEVSETLEALRKKEPCTSEKIAPFLEEEDELADIIIRIMDYAGGYNLDVMGAMLAKIKYNMSRPYKHGKKF